MAHSAHGLIGLSESPDTLLSDHVGHPYESLFMRMSREKAIKEVMSDVDVAIWKPTCEGRIGCLKDGLREGEPFKLLCLLLPISFAKFWRGSSTVGLLVCVFNH